MDLLAARVSRNPGRVHRNGAGVGTAIARASRGFDSDFPLLVGCATRNHIRGASRVTLGRRGVLMGSADSTSTQETPGSDPASLSTLSKHSIRSGAFTLTSTGLQVAVGIAALAVLARVLTPADFGLV